MHVIVLSAAFDKDRRKSRQTFEKIAAKSRMANSDSTSRRYFVTKTKCA
jgi:hypothetical protein